MCVRKITMKNHSTFSRFQVKFGQVLDTVKSETKTKANERKRIVRSRALTSPIAHNATIHNNYFFICFHYFHYFEGFLLHCVWNIVDGIVVVLVPISSINRH